MSKNHLKEATLKNNQLSHLEFFYIYTQTKNNLTLLQKLLEIRTASKNKNSSFCIIP